MAEFQSRRLLAVDDNLALAELIARVAERCGFEARPVTDSEDLQRILRDYQPDILTLDLSMPREDGMSILSLLQESRFAGQIVIISGQEGWLRKAARRLAVGRGLRVAEDLEKPVDVRSLRQVLTKMREDCAMASVGEQPC